MLFKADFSFDRNGEYVGVPIQFEDNSTIGEVIDSLELSIEGDVEKEEIGIFNNQTGTYDFFPQYKEVTKIEKYLWDSNDGSFYNDRNPIHTFNEMGEYAVTITIFSEQFEVSGKKFRFKHTTYKTLELKSKFLKFLKDNYPIWEAVKNEGIEDLFLAASKFFDRLYSDIKELFNLTDVFSINPEYFEYLALTLGHDDYYSRKVSFDLSTENFNQYDIYEKIKNGLATKKEVINFRNFLLASSDMFKKKGTADSVTKILSFFSIDATPIELWTENWGLTAIGEKIVDFTKSSLKDNVLGLTWDNIRVVGNNNDKGHITKNFSSLLIDNFHRIQKLEYDADVVAIVDGGEFDGWVEFELMADVPLIRDITKENGEPLFDDKETTPDNVYRIVPNIPQRFNSNEDYPTILQVNPEFLEFGDRLSVLTEFIENEMIDSLVATTEQKIKDFDAILEFNQPLPFNNLDFDNYRRPENEIFITFRGIDKIDDRYATFNQYYRVAINPIRATMSISKVVQNGKSKNEFENTDYLLVTQKINLTGDKNNLVYDMLILNDQKDINSRIKSIKFNDIYEIKVSVVNDKISVFYRIKETDTKNQNNIYYDKGGIELGTENTSWNALIENLSLDTEPHTVFSVDKDEEELHSEKYDYISDGGNIGFGVRNSVTTIRKFTVNILDRDETLYNDTEKLMDLKPRYLDWLRNQETLANNYKNKNNKFVLGVFEDFDFSVDKNKQVTKEQTDSLNFLFADNIKVNEQLATRYTITFDEKWLNDNFSSKQDLLRKIIVPIGNQQGWFLPENRIFPNSYYGNISGGPEESLEIIEENESFNVTTRLNNLAGLFAYEKNTVLDTYFTEPFDLFSSLETEDRISYNKNFLIRELENAGKEVGVSGLYEEVCPLSNVFSDIELSDGSLYINKLFNPIRITNNGTRDVGVRFKNCGDIKNIINRLSSVIHPHVQLWGSFTFSINKKALAFRPSKYEIRTDPNNSNNLLCDIFVPLGVLSENTRNYSLSTEFMHITNSEEFNIRINGLFVKLYSEHLSMETGSIKVISENPYEDKLNNLFVRRFLNAKINLASKLEEINTLSSSSLPLTYMLDFNTRNLLKNTEINFDYFNWWSPKEIWVKRDFEIQPINLDDDLLSGINYDIDKSFYGRKFDKKPTPLTIRLTDGPVNKYTAYYAKIKIKVDYGGGFSNKNVSPVSSIKSKPLNEQEFRNIKVVGGKKEVYTDWKQSPAGSCYECYVPISWYIKIEEGKEDIIEWANYIENIQDGNITICPYGLMTWFINNSADSTRNIPEQLLELFSITNDWDLTDWNQFFINNLYIEFIAEKVNENNYKLFDKIAFKDIYSINVGSYVDINYDSGEIAWDVNSTTRLFSKASDNFIFEVPKELKPMDSWVGNVKSITMNNLIIPPFLYTVNERNINLQEDSFFNVIKGCDIRGEFSYDLFFDQTRKTITLEDDFDIIRNINWVPFEADESKKYSIVSLNGSEELVFGGEDKLYEIIEIRKQKCFKSLIDKTGLDKSYGKNKSNVENNNQEIIFNKSSIPNITKIYFIDQEKDVFDMSVDIYFDPQLDNLKNYRGKKLEFILKANTFNDKQTNEMILDNYYFVGIGTYDFDVSLGQTKYNKSQDKMQNTFLAGFGDYKSENIESGVWYTLRCIVSKNNIKVLFNRRLDNERLVLNYNINKYISNEQQDNLTGNFEELLYKVYGLDNLDITYPDRLAIKTNRKFLEKNFDENIIKLYKPNGMMSGIRFFNDYTYISNVKYISENSDNKKFSNPSLTEDLTFILSEITQLGYDTDKLEYMSQTLSGTLLIKIEDKLFYKIPNQNLSLFDSNIKKVEVYKDWVIILFDISRKNALFVYDGNLQSNRNILVRDNAFNNDGILRYLQATNREIENFFLSNDTINIIFGDIQ